MQMLIFCKKLFKVILKKKRFINICIAVFLTRYLCVLLLQCCVCFHSGTSIFISPGLHFFFLVPFSDL